MLQRSTQVGEFYRMAPPKSFTVESGKAKGLPPQYLDIVIYDEEMDRHVHITIREALRAALHGNNSITAACSFFGDGTYINKKYAEFGITDANSKSLSGGLTAKDIADSIAEGNWHPVEIIIARPFIEHLMMSAVIAVAGRDTGATLFGPAGKRVRHLALLPCRFNSHAFRPFCLHCFSQTCRSPPTPRSRPSRGAFAFSNSDTRTFSTHFNTVALGLCHTHTLRAQRWLVFYGFSRTMPAADRYLYAAFYQRRGDASLHFLQTGLQLED